MSRWRYFFKRLLLSVPVLFLVMTVIFVVLRMGPLDPVAAMLGPGGLSGANAEAIRENLGLNQPLWQQYIDFITDLITFNLGQSWVLHPNRTVFELLRAFGPRTLWLGFWSILLPLFIGIPLGFYAGMNPNSWGDYIASFGGIIWLAMPNFWLGIMLLTVLRRTDGGDGPLGFDWYQFGPNTDSLIGAPSLDFVDVSSWADLGVVSLPTGLSFEWMTLAVAIKVILPAAIVLGSASMASELRIGRTAVLETINSNYVETAKAKGLSSRVIVWKHVFRNALIPLLPIITNEAFLLIGGSVIVEQVFNINGIGKLFFQSAVQGDLPLAGALIYIFTLIIIFLNIVQDLLYTVLDPRVGYDQ
ncbi:ABC transporter permease [Natronomonas halophila]|uniref:ABC transporter permease n=1 Tax=Natronomonas halophila TaxID=2747817 RepID=UPI0015B45DF5|nr:ABC transporter permease [Natronomonas halophila]QLD86754.1 ABC transporter permease [Natronomonas halophila]